MTEIVFSQASHFSRAPFAVCGVAVDWDKDIRGLRPTIFRAMTRFYRCFNVWVKCISSPTSTPSSHLSPLCRGVIAATERVDNRDSVST